MVYFIVSAINCHWGCNFYRYNVELNVSFSPPPSFPSDNLGLMYSPLESVIGHYHSKKDVSNSLAAAAITGALFKSTGETYFYLIGQYSLIWFKLNCFKLHLHASPLLQYSATYFLCSNLVLELLSVTFFF